MARFDCNNAIKVRDRKGENQPQLCLFWNVFLQTCCEGVLHDNKQGYECCGTHYIPRRNSLDDVCCGGQFYTKLANHHCCGGRFVLSLKFDIKWRFNFKSTKLFGHWWFKRYEEIPNPVHYRYVEVDENQICCVDDTQDRVNVGIGDMCCGSVPYSSNGAQICCDGKRALMPEKETSLSSCLLTSYAVY